MSSGRMPIIEQVAAVIVILTLVLSLVGLLLPDHVYPTPELARTFRANDAVNLMVGVPALAIPLLLIRRGSPVASLLLPGSFLYIFYNTIAYLFGRPLDWLTVLNATLLLLSGWALFAALQAIDVPAAYDRLRNNAPARLGGGALLLFGVAFLGRAVALLAVMASGRTALTSADVGVLLADAVLSALWIWGGALLWRRAPRGYAAGLGLLFASTTLFAALVLFLLINPWLTGAPATPDDVVVVFVMSVICSVPFYRFLRAARSG